MLSQPARVPDPHDDLFRLAMQSSGIGMAIVDMQGRWLEVNPALERMFGRTARELLGSAVSDFTHPDDLAKSADLLQQLVDGRLQGLDAKKRYLRSNGEVLWAHVNVATVRDRQGRATHLIVQVRDVGAQQAAEEALRERNATLEQRVGERSAQLLASQRHQEQFAYGISHDLRAPLRAIDSFASLLANRAGERLDDTERNYLQRIRSATTRMGALIDSLLQLSRVSRVELKRRPVDMGLLAEWVNAELAEAEPGRDVSIEVQPGLVAHGDERLLKVLLQQLLHNAWKFSAHLDCMRITVSGGTSDGHLHLSIADHGCGFDMAYADKLFEPFQRLHGSEAGGGDGIGLAIADAIVRRHDGRIWAEGRPGEGSTFHLQLPAEATGAAEGGHG